MDGGGAAPHRRPMEPGVCHEVSDPPRSAIGPRVSSPHRCRALAPVACRAGLCSPPYPFHCCRSLLLYVYVASLHLFPSLSLSFSSTLFWYDSCSASFFNAPPTILFWGVFLGKKKGAAPRGWTWTDGHICGATNQHGLAGYGLGAHPRCWDLFKAQKSGSSFRLFFLFEKSGFRLNLFFRLSVCTFRGKSFLFEFVLRSI